MGEKLWADEDFDVDDPVAVADAVGFVVAAIVIVVVFVVVVDDDDAEE
jgi:hypothetical protein